MEQVSVIWYRLVWCQMVSFGVVSSGKFSHQIVVFEDPLYYYYVPTVFDVVVKKNPLDAWMSSKAR